jgi:hypothetical protein
MVPATMLDTLTTASAVFQPGLTGS